ncbi:MAG: gamma-glutamyltransferase [Pseudomonadota bacterium]
MPTPPHRSLAPPSSPHLSGSVRRIRAALRTAAMMAMATAMATAAAAQQNQASDARADPEAASGRSISAAVTAEREMIVAAHPAAAKVGAAILAEGGSAADAAIAALLVLNVVEPQSSGLGGGAFALVLNPAIGITTLDGRETAPMAATPDYFFEDGAPLGFWDAVGSGRSVGVPGLGRFLGRLHETHGRLDWARLVRPAEVLAREGFPVSPRLAASIERFAERLAGTPSAAVFMPGGRPLQVGETFRQPALAETLATLAADGPDSLYTGPVAEQIVAAVTAEPRPGAMTLEDIEEYAIIPRSPLCVTYRDAWDICGMGPPSSGATTVGQIMGMVGGFPPAEDPVRRAHLFAEASRLAYADRAQYLGDADHVDVPAAGLLDRQYLDTRRALIDATAAALEPATAGEPPMRDGLWRAPDLSPSRPGTTHLSVVDSDGMAVAITASIEQAFGSGRMAGGVLLNNELTDFSFRPTGADGAPVANAVGPGKRPRSSMAPTIVTAVGEPRRARLVIGSPGGSRIPEYVARALIDMLDHGADPAAAAAAPHVSHRNRGKLTLEDAAHDLDFAEALMALGHEVDTAVMVSGLHIIAIGEDGRLTGGADPRREGLAAGR